MNDNELKSMLKKAYRIEPAPAGLFNRIKDEAENEQALFGGADVKFSVPADRRAKDSSVISFGEAGKKRGLKKSQIIAFTSAAACLLVAVLTLTIAGIFKQDTAPEKTLDETQDVLSTAQLDLGTEKKAPRIKVATENKDMEVTVVSNFVEQLAEPNRALFSEPAPSEAYVSDCFGQRVLVSFVEQKPQDFALLCSAYDTEGNMISEEIELTDNCNVTEEGIDFLFVKNPRIFHENGYDLSKGAYVSFVLRCSFEEESTDYLFSFYVDDSSDEVLATVTATEPLLVVTPLRDRNPFSSLVPATLTGCSFEKLVDEEGRTEEITDHSLQVGDVVLVKYDAAAIDSSFPSILSGAKIIVNPFEIAKEAEAAALTDVIKAYGEIVDLTYINLSTGTDEYVTSDSEQIEKLLRALDGVKVIPASSEDIVNGKWEQFGSNGSDMWQIKFGIAGFNQSVVLRFNALEIVSDMHNAFICPAPSDPTNVKLCFAEDTSFSTDVISGLVAELSHEELIVTAESVLADALNASYEVLNPSGNVTLLKFNRGYSLDLNSDGIHEEIYVAPSMNTDRTVNEIYIAVNKKVFRLSELSGIIEPYTDGFVISDIDSSDAYLELSFMDYGPSEDYTTSFIRFEDDELFFLGEVEGFPSVLRGDIAVSGDGRIRTVKRLGILQTWYAAAEYVVNNRNVIVEAEKDIYYPTYGSSATLLHDLTVYSRMDTGSTSMVAAAGTVYFEATDDRNYVLIKDSNGVEGWMYIEGGRVPAIDGAPFCYEIFEGLNLAD